MSFSGIFSNKYKGDDAATDYAYQGAWSVLVIENLAAMRANRLRKNQVNSPDISFKAFIRSFKDSFSAGWQESQYPNQSVPIAHQSTPRRVIQVEWTVPSGSPEEAVKNLAKCSWLAQSMFPTLKHNSTTAGYTPKSTFMAVKFANLIQSNSGLPLPGYISSFIYTPNFVEGIHILQEKESGWPNGFASKSQKNLFPNVVDISMEFKPIQTRDSFGLKIDGEETGWNNSSWPYGVKIDPKLTPTSKASTNSTSQLTSPRSRAIVEANASKVIV